MSPELLGVGLGALLGGLSFGTLRKIATRVEKPETKTLLNTVAAIELLTLPLIGYLLGAFVFH